MYIHLISGGDPPPPKRLVFGAQGEGHMSGMSFFHMSGKNIFSPILWQNKYSRKMLAHL